MRCSTSSTTMPGSTSMSNSLKSPPSASPRQILNFRVVLMVFSIVRRRGAYLAGLEILDLRVGDLFEVRRSRRTEYLLAFHVSVGTLATHDVVLDPLVALAFVVEPRVRAAALLAQERRARHCFGRDEQRADAQIFVPTGIVLARAGGLHVLRAFTELL